MNFQRRWVCLILFLSQLRVAEGDKNEGSILVLCEIMDDTKNVSTKVTYPCFTTNPYILAEAAEDWPTTENSNVWSIITGVLSAVIAGALVFCGTATIREMRRQNKREERQEVQEAIERGRPLPPKEEPLVGMSKPRKEASNLPKSRSSAA